MPSNFTAFLDRTARSADAEEAAVADNCRFEERASDQRWAQFEKYLPHRDIRAMKWADWTVARKEYLENQEDVFRSSIPDAFLEINRPAWKEGLPEDTSLVRIENLERPLVKWNNPSSRRLTPLELKNKLGSLKSLLQRADSGRDYDAEQEAARFFDIWNNKCRDNRPYFATLQNEVRAECDDDDWPHALRDRLGLGYWGRKPLPVALMCYSLREILTAQKVKGLLTACALPTVLDSMNEFFFPSPAPHPFGATLHLDPTKADVLTAEILHCRIDYERKHLLKLGYVSKPHPQNDDTLRESRDLHLIALRAASGCHDFGEELCVRVSCC